MEHEEKNDSGGNGKHGRERTQEENARGLLQGTGSLRSRETVGQKKPQKILACHDEEMEEGWRGQY